MRVFTPSCMVGKHILTQQGAQFSPVKETDTKGAAFGTHWGLIYFKGDLKGDDAQTLRNLLKYQVDIDFHV